MDTYTTLDNRVISLVGLTADEEAHFTRCHAFYLDGLAWPEFVNLVSGPANPVVAAQHGRVNRAVWEDPLYQALRDLDDRLGIRQGYLPAEPGDNVDGDPLSGDEWLAVTAAARRKGVAVMTIYYAIQRGEIVARPVGTQRNRQRRRVEVSARSVDSWSPVSGRQVAGRARQS